MNVVIKLTWILISGRRAYIILLGKVVASFAPSAEYSKERRFFSFHGVSSSSALDAV